ncbi:FAD-dependent oxidoreductase [Actinosynnema sp. NPDC020468]|uniref:FAD-dependent oxidoreductase n=1 Tax=Actinosynnema sp. NPDC020468 TaxID=3154488 RepID=UPI0033EF98EC
MTDVDVVVIGGGAMGSAAAWQLAARGVDVLLLERFEPGHVFGASHGASRIFRLVYRDPLYTRFAQEALGLWHELGDVLTETGGVDHGDVTGLAEALAAAGSPGRLLPLEEAAERWPGLRFDHEVFFHPRSGRVHADAAVTKLQEAARHHGATVRHGARVRRIEVGAGVTAHTDDGPVTARRAVVAVGAWSRKLLDGLVPLPPLRITQEQPAHFRARDGGEDWPSFIHHRPNGVYGLATPGEGIKVGTHGDGPEVDPDERDFRAEPTRFARLREYVREWLPGLDPDDATPISCTYTTTPNSDFVLDRVGPLTVAAGFSGHGFKFVPAVGRVLADLVTSGTRPDPRFRLDIPGIAERA